MTSKLLRFMDILLSDPITSVSAGTGNRAGFVMYNPTHDCRVYLFSEAPNSYYFELNFTKVAHNSYYNQQTPVTYKTEDFNVVKPILEKYIERAEGYANQRIKGAREYVDLFKKILRNEALTDEYEVIHGTHRIEIGKPDNDFLAYIDNKVLDEAVKIAKLIEEPTGHISLIIENIDDSNNPAIMYIPQIFFKKYKFLQNFKEQKSIRSLTTVEDEWFSQIKNRSTLSDTSILKLLDYLDLNDTLNNQKIEIGKRPKI